VDSYGNAYVTGRTYSPDYPVKNGAYDKSWNGYSDVFVTKLNAIGNTLIYSTFIGSYEPEYGYGIAVDSSGNAYVTGSTDSNTYPVTSGAFDTSFNSFSWDAFVTKLSAGGDALIYSTFLGGNSCDYGYAIAVDGSGNAYVTGSTISSNYPVTSGAFDTSFSGAEAFVTKLNTSGTALIYSTFLGESSSDWQHSGAFGNGIVIDRFGNAYVTGSTI
jgi:hypothetical protein